MANSSNRAPRVPAEYKPITMWGYFGYQILFSIPIIGWIFVIIFAISAENINLKNFARSQFCLWIIWLVFFLLTALTGALGAILNGIWG